MIFVTQDTTHIIQSKAKINQCKELDLEYQAAAKDAYIPITLLSKIVFLIFCYTL